MMGPHRGSGRKVALMGARGAIERSFKTILATKPYKKITVSEICEGASVSRKAFYALFQDKEAIVESLFDQHVVKPLRDLQHALVIADRLLMQDAFTLRMYEALYREKDYYTHLIGPMRGNDDTFLRVATWGIYDLNMQHIEVMGRISASWKRDYASYFFASSQAMLMQKWISDGMVVSPKELAKLYNSFTMPFWKGLLQR